MFTMIEKFDNNIISQNQVPDHMIVEETSSTLENVKVSEPSQMTPEEGLQLVVSRNLSKETYLHLKKTAENHNHKLYPAYEKVTRACFF